jgi:hypothetical protein
MSWESSATLVLLIAIVKGENTADGSLVLRVMTRLADGRSVALIRTDRTVVLPAVTEDTNSSTMSSLQHAVRTGDSVFWTLAGTS